jgi:hypothetical protein
MHKLVLNIVAKNGSMYEIEKNTLSLKRVMFQENVIIAETSIILNDSIKYIAIERVAGQGIISKERSTH